MRLHHPNNAPGALLVGADGEWMAVAHLLRRLGDALPADIVELRTLLDEQYPSRSQPEPPADCGHEKAATIKNLYGTPVRLWCQCGRSWRIVPDAPDALEITAIRAWLAREEKGHRS